MGWATVVRSPVVRRAAAVMVLSCAGVAGIVKHEATVPIVYQDVIGINTVCTGHVTKLAVGTRVSGDTCAQLLQEDTAIAQSSIRRGVKTQISQNQYDALTSLVFNIGTGAFASSTLLRKLNADDCHGAAAEFTRWNRGGGRVLRGLTNRRASERALFEQDCP